MNRAKFTTEIADILFKYFRRQTEGETSPFYTKYRSTIDETLKWSQEHFKGNDTMLTVTCCALLQEYLSDNRPFLSEPYSGLLTNIIRHTDYLPIAIRLLEKELGRPLSF